MRSAGIEPALMAPEANALSTELRAQNNLDYSIPISSLSTQKDLQVFCQIYFYNAQLKVVHIDKINF